MRDPEFWHNKWASNQIGFHLDDVNPLLEAHWQSTRPTREATVLVPLCGKSEDLAWLAQRHDDVQAVELSQIAVRAFFAEHFYTPLVTQINAQHELYQFDELSVYTGDIFTTPVQPVDIIYDRGALVAFPEEMRAEYVRRLLSVLKPGGRILLIGLDFAPADSAKPPFSVPAAEIRALFASCRVTCLQRNEADEHHPDRAGKGRDRFAEEVWLIEA